MVKSKSRVFLRPFLPACLVGCCQALLPSFSFSFFLILLSDEALMKLATLLLRGRRTSILPGAFSPSTLPSKPCLCAHKGGGEVNASSSPLAVVAPVAPALPGWYPSRQQRARGGRKRQYRRFWHGSSGAVQAAKKTATGAQVG